MHLAVLGAFKKIIHDGQKIYSKKLIYIIRNYVTVGLNVEEVGGRRESQSPKAHSLGHRPR